MLAFGVAAASACYLAVSPRASARGLRSRLPHLSGFSSSKGPRGAELEAAEDSVAKGHRRHAEAAAKHAEAREDVDLTNTTFNTTTSTTTQLTCLGFGTDCPAYPMPYGPEEAPESYDYAGDFPDDFVWGMGTAAYQIEGAYRDEGRGASIWDTFTGANTVGMPGAGCTYCCKAAPCKANHAMLDKGATGNVACNHYRLWQTDLALMKSMSLKHYRFSLSWPRLVPTGKVKDGVNPHASRFYNELIDALLEAGITPLVTLYHWDLPQGLLDPDRGEEGWWSRDADGRPDGKIMQDWLDYAELCFKLFGDRVKTWITFNEPWTFLFLGSGYGNAPGIPEFSNMTSDPWIAGHNVLNAHAAAVDLYRRHYQPHQHGKIGITNNCDWREPATDDPQDIAAAERSVLFQLGWFAEPIFGEDGDYPAVMREVYGERLPEFTKEQKKLLKGSADFFGLNHYGSAYASYTNVSGADLSYAHLGHKGDMPRAHSSWLYGCGWGFHKILVWIFKRYDNPPIYVTEGGWSQGTGSAEEIVSDQSRTLYYANYTAAMRQAIVEDGVDVRGYFAWSLMDNFEWAAGYKSRFGATYANFAMGVDENAPSHQNSQPTGKQWRRRKDSSCWLEKLWTTSRLSSPVAPHFWGCVDSSVFDRSFVDKRRPHCLRRIVVNETAEAAHVVSLTSHYPEPRCSGPVDDIWGRAVANVSGGTILINAGDKYLSGFWNRAAEAIDWSDGSTWITTSSLQVESV